MKVKRIVNELEWVQYEKLIKEINTYKDVIGKSNMKDYPIEVVNLVRDELYMIKTLLEVPRFEKK